MSTNPFKTGDKAYLMGLEVPVEVLGTCGTSLQTCNVVMRSVGTPLDVQVLTARVPWGALSFAPWDTPADQRHVRPWTPPEPGAYVVKVSTRVPGTTDTHSPVVRRFKAGRWWFVEPAKGCPEASVWMPDMDPKDLVAEVLYELTN